MSDSSASIAPFRPRQLGRLALVHRLAIGGMGEVFLARQLSELNNFGRVVAAKLLLQSYSQDQSFVGMFLDEASVVARLNHPNIVQVHDVGCENDQYYIVMEYLPGQTLTEIMSSLKQTESRLPPRLACESLSLVAEALGYAHGFGLVHRDVTLSNIMFTDHGAVKLIDFGVARASNRASFTTPGVLKGKFGYMAPEYLNGNEYDHRSDLYSLGVVLYEVLSGRRLFKAASAAQSIQRILNETIVPLHEVNPTISVEVSAVVMRALQRDPDQRFASGHDMAEALRAAAAELPSEKGMSTLARWIQHKFSGSIADRAAMLRDALAAVEIPPAAAPPEAGSSDFPVDITPNELVVSVSGHIEADESASTGGEDGPSPLPPPPSVAAIRAEQETSALRVPPVARPAPAESVSAPLAVGPEAPAAAVSQWPALEPPPRAEPRSPFFWPTAALLVVAALGAVLFVSVRGKPARPTPVAQPASLDSAPAKPSAPNVGEEVAAAARPAPTQELTAPTAPLPGDCERRRQAGVDAFSGGEYASAVASFADALRAHCPDADLPALMRSAKEMADQKERRHAARAASDSSAREWTSGPKRRGLPPSPPHAEPARPTTTAPGVATPPAKLEVPGAGAAGSTGSKPPPRTLDIDPNGGTAPHRKLDVDNPYGVE